MECCEMTKQRQKAQQQWVSEEMASMPFKPSLNSVHLLSFPICILRFPFHYIIHSCNQLTYESYLLQRRQCLRSPSISIQMSRFGCPRQSELKSSTPLPKVEFPSKPLCKCIKLEASGVSLIHKYSSETKGLRNGKILLAGAGWR